MGNCLSRTPSQLIEQSNGGEKEFHERYVEEQVLGEGEFGQVKLVYPIGKDGRPEEATPYACKTLRKGAVFKDNTLYTPIKPEILKGEIEMLRKLEGKHYCMYLEAVYETPRSLLMVTEFCGGGEMMEYVANRKEDLRTEDVSRICYQLFSAVNHCFKNGIIHRDIKPENCMFVNSTLTADLRLIDFGSGTMGAAPKDDSELEQHSTFAGSAFYISPELFQRTYTARTDVWSCGAALYVLVAGYPGQQLQKAFNIMQNGKPSRNLRDLPNLPDDMPDTYYELLDKALTYRHKQRPSAGEICKMEFAQFHIQHAEGISLGEVAAAAALPGPGGPGNIRASLQRTASISLRGSVNRHGLFLGFKNYERSLTALLASMLTKRELEQLVDLLKNRLKAREQHSTEAALKLIQQETELEGLEELETLDKDKQLSVVQVREIKTIIRNEIGNVQAVTAIDKLEGGQLYEGFAYHVYLLKDFDRDPGGSTMSSSGRRQGSFRRGSFRGPSGSFRSDAGSVRSTGMRNSSRSGGNLFRSVSMRKNSGKNTTETFVADGSKTSAQ